MLNAFEALVDKTQEPIVKIRVVGDMEDILITIQDNGPSLSPEVKAKFFDPFVVTNKSNGSGLGLYLVWESIIEAGGKIHHSGVTPNGTLFSIRFPVNSQNP